MEINLKSKIYNLKSPFPHLLTILFILINGALLMKQGIMTDDDTWGYLQYAAEIREQGLFFKPHLFWYIGYTLFILGANTLIPGLEGIVVFQYSLAYIALIAIYFTSINIYQNPKTALLTGLWFLGFFMISFWNLFIYAESLLISLYCISFYFLSKAYRGNLKTYQAIIAVFIFAWAILVKPTAVALLAGLLAVSISYAWQRLPTPAWKLAFSTTVILGFLLLLNQMLSTFGFVRDYQIGEIVYNIHTIAYEPYAKYLMLEVPKNLYLPNPDHPALWKLLTIIIMNPWYSLKLFVSKAFYFLFYIRPYFSWIHNIIALIALLPMYYFAVKQLRAKNFDPVLKYFVITFLTVAVFSVCLLTINWNSRFLVPLLPLIFLIGAGGMTDIVRSKFKMLPFHLE